ncbi:hypothetical protein ACIS_00150 [Anaplasma centrale str. Israel]|uniref:Uncharacterized protein n=1 Tax=Anaplasma centrale (strain Israel) TaxID=574556 RepID=D1ATG5_ANACI|nr:hypothetical protein [Anaplasma centrale]ACZ48843.1 hypothetical protein ACIS_00150 [Anaplasma centrale str. Israel]
MPYNSGVAHSAEDISRRFALFIPGKGMVRFGHFIPGVTPTSELIGRSLAGEALPAGSTIIPAEFDNVLLSRTFCFFDSDPTHVRRAVALLASSGLIVRVVCNKQDREYLIRNGISSETCISDARHAFPSQNAVALLYHREYSRVSFGGLKALMVLESAPQEMRQLLSKTVSRTGRAADTGNRFFTARYDASSKPVGQKLLDSVLYMEKWSLLSSEERAWRCAGSALLTLVMPIMPIIFALLVRGRNNDAAYNLGIMRWQDRVYRDRQHPKSTPYDMLFGNDADAALRLTDTVTKVASEPGFGYMDSNHRLTEQARVASMQHNFLLLADRKHLSNRDLALRVAFLAVIAMLTISSIVQLSLGNIAHPGASIASAVSYCALLGICAGSLYMHRKDTKRLVAFGILAFACLALLANSIAAFHLGGPGPVVQGLETLISTALIALSGVYCVVVCAANFAYRQDKAVSSELGMSFTAYRDIKPKLYSELRNYDQKAASAGVLVRILEDSGEDVTTLLRQQDETSSVTTTEAGEITPPRRQDSVSSAEALDPTNPFAVDIAAERRAKAGATGNGAQSVSSHLQDVVTTEELARISSPSADRAAKSA